jgi:prepilin-type processing-associated H-X9-DG protein
MSQSSRENKKNREQLRAYLLDTLADAERSALEVRLADSEDLRAQLEAERTALARLDELPALEPDKDLAAKVMRHVRAWDTQEHREGHEWGRRFLVYAGAITAVLLVSATLLPALSRSREASRRASSANNLKQLGMIMKMYANESKGELFPPLVPQEGVWGIDVSVLYPKLLRDPKMLIDPGHPRAKEIAREMDEALEAIPPDWDTINRLAAQSYTYLGWSATDTEALAKLKEAQPQRFAGKMQLAQDFENQSQIFRLREGIERFYITDINNPASSANAQSEIPVMFETLSSIPGGRNVLYMDGHVEFVRYGDTFPATIETDKILGIENNKEP